MKLTKKLEAEIVRAYLIYWDAYLKGDMKTFASFLDDNLITYGTAGSEIFNSKKEAVNFYKATADQMTGKADFRKRKISAKAVGDTIVVNEQSDLYVLVDGAWIFYGHSRITAIFEQKGNTWKLVHQHASFPDSRTEEGEQIATKKIRKENLELREAVRRRTIELEGKNRELEIEAAMEKVRAVAMGMTKAEDMLSICKTISQQLAKLGVKEIRNVQTAIFYPASGTYMNYEYYHKHNKTFITEVDYKNHKVQLSFANKMMKGRGETVVEHFKGQKLKEWYAFQKTTNQFADKYLLTALSLNYYWFSIGPVALGISTYSLLKNEELELFQRFLKVFELAYRRYLDIEKATAQAREAQIEAALERIRARALAMHSSDEFTDVARVMREQMGKLGQQELETSAVHLYEEDADTIFSWRAFRLSSDLKSRVNYGFFKIPKKSCAIAREFVQKFKSKATDYTIDVSGARQTEWYKILFKLAPEVQAAMKKSGTTREKRYYHFSKFSGGALLMVSSKEPSNDAIELQKRAAQVFDLAYRRFKDLQKAEAQAREAQIEAALERIRAASLAMQDSSALGEIIYKLYGELTKLDAKLDRCFIMIVNPDNKGITWWMAGHEGLLAENGFFVQMNQHPSHLMYLDYCKKRKKKWTYLFEGKEKRDWDRFGFSKTELAKLPEPIKAFMAAAKKVHLCGSSDQFGSLVTGSFEPLPEEQQEIISRFAIAFNQAYIRFLDLQKAEAQAKESQIQLALERVRARTMAMQKSEELPEAANLLFHQIQSLGMPAWSAGYCIWSDDKKNVTLWMSSEGVLQPPFKAPTTEDELFIQMRKGHEKGKSLHVVEMGGKKLEAHYTYMRTLPVVGEVLDSIIEAGHPLPTFQVMHYAYFSKGYLLFITYEPVPDAHEIFIRFANVFEQTYTRFLDLQKAEAQAREAQIQLALERIRARSLAMHHTSELQDVANILAQQLHTMGMDINGGVFITINKEVENDLPLWASAGAADYVQKAVAPFFDKPIFTHLRDAIKKGNNFFAETYSKKEKDEMFRHLFRYEPWKSTTAERKKELLSRKGGLTRAAVISRYTSIAVTNHNGKSFSDAENEVLKRFGNVFEQSYIRFLDLQKAEAQAREAKIEAALERVRSRSLAMHHSSELSFVVDTLLKEFTNLEFTLTFCIINLINEQDRSNTVWAANPETGKAPESYYMKFEDYPFHHAMWDAWKKQNKNFIYTIEGEEKKIYDEYLYTKTEFRRFPKHVQEANKALKRYVAGFTFFKYSGLQTVSENHITNEDLNILERFGRVFEQCYTRFLDLQKAEAQAREAQIEASLEKVRSRSMAMQQPEELVEVAELLRREMGQLGVEELETSSIYIVEKETKQAECWYAIKDVREEDTRLVSDEMPLLLTDTWVGKQMWKFYLSGGERISILMKGERRKEWINYCAKHSKVLQGYYGEEIPDRTYHLVKFNGGYIGAAAPGDISAESWDLLKRVSTVFSLAYTRFKDLQDAAARAREAQIELALERVRSRSMAMHKSDELKEVIRLVLQQFIQLNINAEHAGFYIDYKAHDDMHIWLADPNIEPYFAILPYFDTPTWNSFLESKAKGIAFHTDLLDFKEKNKFYKSLFKLFEIPEEAKRFYLECKGLAVSTVLLDNVGLYIENFQGIPYAEEENKILMRFGKVFQQTYTRFLDLQKVEAQAREAEIELGLERVRARAMAMQKSEELKEAATVLYKELMALHIGNLYNCGYVLIDEEDQLQHAWMTHSDGRIREAHTMPLQGDPIMDERFKQWKKGNKFFCQRLGGKQLRTHLAFVAGRSHSVSSREPSLPQFPDPAYFYCGNFPEGYLHVISPEELSKESELILSRFTTVFEQTYTRFLDLQKAESQAREAKIESALERVRAKTMAMQHSNELADAAQLLFHQVEELGVHPWTSGFQLWDEDRKSVTVWTSTKAVLLPPFKVPITDDTLMKHIAEAADKEDPLYVEEMGGEALADHYKFMLSLPTLQEVFGKVAVEGHTLPTFQVNHAAYFSYGYLLFITHDPVPAMHDIFKRFAKVFEGTYTRFLDLQRAEAQAREAQIEAALERVRSRSMAMHKSEELSDLSLELVKQVQTLGVATWFCAFNIYDEEANNSVEWGSNGQGVFSEYRTPREGVFLQYYKAGKRGESLHIHEITEDKCATHYEYLCSLPGVGDQLLQMKAAGIPFPKYQIDHVAFFKQGYLLFITYEPVPEAHDIFKRFAKVFEQSYTRFLDLKNAEAQAREAQVEAALERVRSRSMAMHKSDELLEAGEILFSEMQKLGIESLTAGFVLMDKDEKNGLNYTPDPSTKKIMSLPVIIPHNETIHMQRVVENWKKGTSHYVVEMDEEETIQHQTFIAERSTNFTLNAEQLIAISPARLFLHNFYFKEGYLLIVGGTRLSAEQIDIMLRFAKVFQQTYTRFLDLQKAEAQARESQIQLALERVRARTMAMQRSEELPEVAGLLFQQVKALGVPQFHCGFNIFEIDDKECTWYPGSADGDILPPCKIPLTEHPVFMNFIESRKRGDELCVYEKEGEYQAGHYKYMLSLPVLGEILQNMLDAGIPFPIFQIDHLANFSHGNLLFITSEHFPEMHDTFKRFAKVFEQTYTRFLDLQKAEVQARESQIQLSLERVRARSMAMQQSDELSDVLSVLFNQFDILGIKPVYAHLSLINIEENTFSFRMTGTSGQRIIVEQVINLDERPEWQEALETWKNSEPGVVSCIHYPAEVLPQVWEVFGKIFKSLPPDSMIYPEQFPDGLFTTQGHCRFGYIGFNHTRQATEEEKDILKRISNEFGLVYQRFLDLKRAEIQAKEAQIEAALERVRSRSIAMRKSEELAEIAAKIFTELKQLDLVLNRVLIWTFNDTEKYTTWWSANPEVESTADSYRIDYNENPVFIHYLEAWQQRKPLILFKLAGETKKTWEDHLFENTELSRLPMEVRKGIREEGDIFTVSVISDYGIMMSGSYEPLSDASIDIIQRFGRVFQQSYTRYLDVQKAEAQAREAQIEAALERVRSRSMAMHDSKELGEVAKVMFNQMKLLGGELFAFGIVLCDKNENVVEQWHGLGEGDMMTPFQVPVDLDYIHRYRYDQWKAGVELFSIEIPSEYIARHFELMFALPSVKIVMDDLKSKGIELSHPSWEIDYGASFRYGYLLVSSLQPYAEEKIFPRFAKVFEQAYTRFLDLQKAEAQAREAQIEAALERVRSRSLAMHSSGELGDVVTVVLNNLMELGYIIEQGSAAHLVIFSEGTKDFVQWSADPALPHPVRSFIPYTDLPILTEFWDARQKGHDFFARVYSFDEKNTWFNFAFEHSDLKHIPGELKKLLLESETYAHSIAIEKNSAIIINSITGNQLSENQIDILRRFSKVFEQAYTRFLDLQKAEAQAREAQIEAALEKVRSRTLAMQKSDELAGTAAVLFQQLISLGIEPNRLYIILIKENTADMEAWVTDEDGSKVSMGFTGNYRKNETLLKMYEGWRANKGSLVIDMQGEELQQYFHYLHDELNVPFKGGLEQKRRVQHIAYFSHGLIGMASPEEQPAATMQLLERFAAVFNLTFTRFNDLQIAEAHARQAELDLIAIKEAKQKAEEALTELQATQKQLIQSEKMASLGELTAGIAHEIQNPLNFVNNFSEVSKELLEEMKDAVEKGNVEDAKEIMHDVIQNLEKINHHGKRADGIVKGMLQHSRSSSGQKELTDINALCDEYLRLAYHGLRAKDKSFNAKFEADLDAAVGKINLLPQDMGRVVLNLINNAFYAVSERKKANEPGYEPIVTVSTLKKGNTVEIKVTDNGTGIPQKVLDKIFQPFFTTKPTGQGTGLGLSLSYDIVTKAHGGELTVETKEGEGTSFIIKLPV